VVYPSHSKVRVRNVFSAQLLYRKREPGAGGQRSYCSASQGWQTHRTTHSSILQRVWTVFLVGAQRGLPQSKYSKCPMLSRAACCPLTSRPNQALRNNISTLVEVEKLSAAQLRKTASSKIKLVDLELRQRVDTENDSVGPAVNSLAAVSTQCFGK
jgi:hypothetical protein